MKYDKLPNIKILDESNKVIHQKSSDVTFPLKEETSEYSAYNFYYKFFMD